MTSFDPLSFASFTPLEMVIGGSRLFTLSLLIDLARAVRPLRCQITRFYSLESYGLNARLTQGQSNT